MRTNLLLGISIFLAFTNMAPAEEAAGFKASAEIEPVSSFVWRAIPQGKRFATQGTATIGYGGLSGGVLGNYSTENDRTKNTLSEVDYFVSYEVNYENWVFEPGYTYYTLPNTIWGTFSEVGGRVSYKMNPFKVYTSHYVSFGSSAVQGGYYGDVGVGYETEFMPKWKFESTVSLGFSSPMFNNFNYGPASKIWALDGVVLEMQAPYSVTENFYLKPHVLLTDIITNTLRSNLATGRGGVNRPANAVFGLAVGYKF